MADIESTFSSEMSFDNYKNLSNLMIISFILLSFRPPKSFLHSITLITITACLMIRPIFYRGRYSSKDQASVSVPAITLGFKMCIWLIHSIPTSNKLSRSDEDFQPFFYTLFCWRKNVTSGKKDDFQPTNKQIIKNILERISVMFVRWIIYESCFKLLDTYCDINEIPSTPYFFRIIDMFKSGTPPITIKLLLLCLFYIIIVYIVMGLGYDQFPLISSFVLLFLNIIFPSLKEEPNDKVKKSFFKGKIISIKRWCILFLFDTKYIFDSPWLSTSPRDFWSIRWHTFYNESFKELGYIPLRNFLLFFFDSSTSSTTDVNNNSENKKKLARMVGTIGAFCLSGILHEYILWTSMNKLTFEQFNFFLFNAIVLIIWELISTKDKKGGNKSRIILFLIMFFSLPSMIEPYFRHEKWTLRTVFTDINRTNRN